MANTIWKLDPTHSELGFKVKHLMISTVKGLFKTFDVTAETAGDDFSSPASIQVEVETASIDTNNEQRDGHLKSEDFFAAGEHPKIVFKSTGYKGTLEEGILTGDLTIRGITKQVEMNVEHGGIAADPYGQTKAGFTVEGKINRKEFGLQWNAVTEAGNVVVSDEVKFSAEIQLIKQ